jgi:ribosomal biogenesis protein LAS1
MSQAWTENSLATMDDRLQNILGALTAISSRSQDEDSALDHEESIPPMNSFQQDLDSLPAGWTLLSEGKGWRPAPIGVFVTCPQKAESRPYELYSKLV